MWIEFDRVNDKHEAYLECVGRCLAISQHFESSCRYILGATELIVAWDAGEIDDLHKDHVAFLAKALRHRALNGIVKKLNMLGQVSDDELEILECGRVARNYIAHEVTLVVTQYPDFDDEFEKKIEEFKAHLRNLVTADNEVSAWSYEAEERVQRPYTVFTTYPQTSFEWVMEPLNAV